MTLNDNFKQAVEFARLYIKEIIDRGVIPVMDSITRSTILGVHMEDFDCKTALHKSEADYDAFDSLKRYCAQQIRKDADLPEELKLWVAGYLDEFVHVPPRKEGQKRDMGREINMFLPQLIHKIVIDYGLPATRNRETRPKISACDAVVEAVSRVPNAHQVIKRVSFDSLARAYTKAKKQNTLIR